MVQGDTLREKVEFSEIRTLKRPYIIRHKTQHHLDGTSLEGWLAKGTYFAANAHLPKSNLGMHISGNVEPMFAAKAAAAAKATGLTII